MINNVFLRYKKEELNSSYNYFKKYFKSTIFLSKKKIREHAISLAIESENNKASADYYLEFGVFKGESINLFSKFLKKKIIYGFDTFYGLTEPWKGYVFTKGHFDLKGKLPRVKKNVCLIKGDVRKTLKTFLNKKKPKIKFIHMDVDTYESTKIILKQIKPFLSSNSYILFDEYYNISGWKNGEFKAFTELFKKDEYNYIAFAIDTSQVLIKIK